MAAWGLKPGWLKEKGDQIINARAETAKDKPYFASMLSERRCLVPADGFYEWKPEEDGSKTPYRVAFADRSPFAFAGIWEPWTDEKGVAGFTFAIITVEANEIVKPIHERMPAILLPEDEKIWLDLNYSADDAYAVLKPYPTENLAAFAVSSLVNSPKYDAPSLIVPVHHRGA
jgi:putative SOS response-associated peptidase YedK